MWIQSDVTETSWPATEVMKRTVINGWLDEMLTVGESASTFCKSLTSYNVNLAYTKEVPSNPQVGLLATSKMLDKRIVQESAIHRPALYSRTLFVPSVSHVLSTERSYNGSSDFFNLGTTKVHSKRIFVQSIRAFGLQCSNSCKVADMKASMSNSTASCWDMLENRGTAYHINLVHGVHVQTYRQPPPDEVEPTILCTKVSAIKYLDSSTRECLPKSNSGSCFREIFQVRTT